MPLTDRLSFSLCWEEPHVPPVHSYLVIIGPATLICLNTTMIPKRPVHLLAQAGFTSDRPVRLTYTTSSDPFRIRLATILQHQLAEVGIECDLRSYDWGTFYGDIKAGRFQLYSLSWVGIKTPDIFSYVFHSRSIPPHGANRGRFIDDTANRLIDEAEAAQDAL